MAIKKIVSSEIVRKNSKTKNDEFFYIADGIDVKSRVLDRKKGLEIHYPFDPRDGSQKYKYISSISFQDISPAVVHGVFKNWNRGYGFTRNLSPLVSFLENYPSIGSVIIKKKGNSKFKKTEIVLNIDDIERIYQRILPFRKQQTSELRSVTKNSLAAIFPKDIKKEELNYNPGELTRFIENRSINSDQLSQNDIQSVGDLISSLSSEHSFIKKGNFIRTKEKFDIVSIEATLKKFRKLLKRKNETKNLEDSWHQFFKNNSWILSQMFAAPMLIFEEKAYVGGKDIHNSQGKIADFIYRNKFSNSVVIIEIKTHNTILIDKTPYRKPDVFSVSRHLSGAINQALDQKDTLQKDYHTVTKGKGVESFNPICVVLAGQSANIKSDCIKSFELFRSNSKDVVIVTFDELLSRIETVLAIFRKKR